MSAALPRAIGKKQAATRSLRPLAPTDRRASPDDRSERPPRRADFRRVHLKTVKLRGQVSQGICFPLSILPPDDAPRVEMSYIGG